MFYVLYESESFNQVHTTLFYNFSLISIHHRFESVKTREMYYT